MNYNPFEHEPTDDDLALTDVVLTDDNGNVVGFDTPTDDVPCSEFVGDDEFPDEWYDHLAEFSSGTYYLGSWIGTSGTC